MALAKPAGDMNMGSVVGAIRRSLVAKVFLICFFAVHLPLISLLLYIGLGSPPDPLPILTVALCATLLGAGLSYLAVYKLVSPIDRLIGAVDRYQKEGVEPFVAVKGSDGVKRLADKVLDLVRAQENSLRVLKREAESDCLTGLGNRRWLQNAVANEISRAARQKAWVWVIVFDLDHFKRINDRFGHPAGDQVLVTVAEVAQRQLRAGDLFARIGGEEFCVILNDTGANSGGKTAERIRAALEACSPAPAGAAVTITASFGVHRGDPAVQSFADMLQAADESLYRAKSNGRNQVVETTRHGQDGAASPVAAG